MSSSIFVFATFSKIVRVAIVGRIAFVASSFAIAVIVVTIIVSLEVVKSSGESIHGFLRLEMEGFGFVGSGLNWFHHSSLDSDLSVELLGGHSLKLGAFGIDECLPFL